MKATLNFTSVGKTHPQEANFFKFLVQSKFNDSGCRAIQWCCFDGLSVIIDAFNPEVVDYAINTISNSIETPTGYKFIKQ